MNNIKIVKNKDNPEPTPVLAEAIIRISEAFDDLKKGDLNEEAIITLIVDSCPTTWHGSTKRIISKSTVRLVLETIRKLKGRYCRTL